MGRIFSRQDIERLEDALRRSEKQTSGEIRIHIVRTCGDDPKADALRSFRKLGMMKTAARNGILIFIATESRKFVILGDKGINSKVEDNYWNDIRDLIGSYFSQGLFVEGLEKAILQVGDKLREFFPYSDDDVNELPDEIVVDDIK